MDHLRRAFLIQRESCLFDVKPRTLECIRALIARLIALPRLSFTRKIQNDLLFLIPTGSPITYLLNAGNMPHKLAGKALYLRKRKQP